MDLILLERFLSAMVPGVGKPAVHTAFEIMRAQPMSSIPSIAVMIQKFHNELQHPQEEMQARACGLLLTGIMLAKASEDPNLKNILLEDYIERLRRYKGENVVDFFDKKAGR